MESEKLYTVREVAAKLRVSIQAVRRYITEGHLNAVTLPGGYYRIPESELSKITQPEAPVTQSK
ncbi:MAG: helix-turn-helix domain-containing protein [Chloroflexi bacterium]|nr:helix-turn-helix domain-containing protein [Chloroflexota bacterium]